jgi:hypothetical protein
VEEEQDVREGAIVRDGWDLRCLLFGPCAAPWHRDLRVGATVRDGWDLRCLLLPKRPPFIPFAFSCSLLDGSINKNLIYCFLKFNSLGKAPGVYKFQIWGQTPVRPKCRLWESNSGGSAHSRAAYHWANGPFNF